MERRNLIIFLGLLIAFPSLAYSQPIPPFDKLFDRRCGADPVSDGCGQGVLRQTIRVDAQTVGHCRLRNGEKYSYL